MRTSPRKIKRSNLLRRTSWSKRFSIIKWRQVEDMETTRQGNHFTLSGGMVSKPTATHWNQQDTDHLVIFWRVNGRRNFRSEMILIKPTTADKYTSIKKLLSRRLRRSMKRPIHLKPMKRMFPMGVKNIYLFTILNLPFITFWCLFRMFSVYWVLL